MKPKYKHLKLILGDQLHPGHSWFRNIDENSLFVMMEIRPESEYVTHHIQKVVGIFSAMRSFCDELSEQGHAVRYFRISDADNRHSFRENLLLLVNEYGIENFHFQEPDEYRLDQILEDTGNALGIPFTAVSSEHFLTDRYSLKAFFKGRSPLMETFYRHLRKKYSILMEGDKPVTGRWNYDKENRKKLPSGYSPPPPSLFDHDVSHIVSEMSQVNINTIGTIEPGHFIWPVNRTEALNLLYDFFENHFVNFGTYQDAMSNEYWSLHHSRISFAMNLKMITPLEVIKKAESWWLDHHEEVSLAQAEGFIRQILGWREYMRGIYWWQMPAYQELNFFELDGKLPAFFWTGKTRMNCVRKAVEQSLNYAYAHHIQRLMVTGNFCLLAGIDPDEVDKWYLGIYIDAFQWVEITNTRGMSQFADGGIVGTKPYISSASYIHKMGNHCSTCTYNHKAKTGENACPFNSLYWNFLDIHRQQLSGNRRMTMMYRVWDKFPEKTKTEIRDQAEMYLNSIESL